MSRPSPPCHDERQTSVRGPAGGVGAINLIGPLAKILALATGGKQPEDQLHPRGFLGIELAEAAGELRAAGVLADSPAARAGVRPGDLLLRILDHEVANIKAARDSRRRGPAR